MKAAAPQADAPTILSDEPWQKHVKSTRTCLMLFILPLFNYKKKGRKWTFRSEHEIILEVKRLN